MKKFWNWINANEVSNDLGGGCLVSVFRWVGVICIIIFVIVYLIVML